MAADVLRTLQREFAGASLADLHHGCQILTPDETIAWEKDLPRRERELVGRPHHGWQILTPGETVESAAYLPALERELVGRPLAVTFLRLPDGRTCHGCFFGDPDTLRRYRRLSRVVAQNLRDVPAAARYLDALPAPLPADVREPGLVWTQLLYVLGDCCDSPRLRVGHDVWQIWSDDAPTIYIPRHWLAQDLFTASAAALDLILQPQEPPTATERLTVEVASRRVILDGVPVVVNHPAAFRLIQALIDHSHTHSGGVMTREDFDRRPGLKGRIDRLIRQHMPLRLQFIIRSRSGHGGGYWLQLAPQKVRHDPRR
jgi:hypothetical protein